MYSADEISSSLEQSAVWGQLHSVLSLLGQTIRKEIKLMIMKMKRRGYM